MNVVFNSDFLEDIKKLGNSVKLIKYFLEDYENKNPGYTLQEIIDKDKEGSSYYPKIYYGQGKYDDSYVRGIWDKNRKEFITHFSLPDNLPANVVRYNTITDEPEELDYEFEIDGKKKGNSLFRIIRFVYNERFENNNYKTAFLLTGDIQGTIRDYTIDPIRLNQDRNIITIQFPDYTKANILPYTIENDTKFLETYGIEPGINIFLNSEEENLVSRESYYKYLRVCTGDLQNFQTPYIDSSGKDIEKNYIFRDYKKLNIDCAGLYKTVTPNTKPELSLEGGTINIYGTAEYNEYVILDNEAKFLGSGEEPINNVPNMKIVFSGNGELKDVKLDTEIISEEAYSTETETRKFRVSYGRFEGQEDPSKLINFKLNFYDPILNVTKEITSKKIKITQLDTVLNEWEIYDRTTIYFEEDKPVYMFPWQSGFEHSFKIRTSLRNLSINDFSMIYENEYLDDLFKYEIEFRRDNSTYPYFTYIVTLKNKIDNEDINHWLPFLNNESTLLLATFRLNDYEYEEQFYMVQSPKVERIELHENPDNSNVTSIDFATDETERVYYPVAPLARTEEEIGERNTWKIFSSDNDVNVIPSYGRINPNTIEGLTNEMKIVIERQAQTIEPLVFNDLIVGRIKENEVNMTLDDLNWRNIINLSTVSIPLRKEGTTINIETPDGLVLKEINLYELKVNANGPIACYLNYEEGFENKYSFFNPYNNTITYQNHFYSRDPDTPLYIALTELDEIVEELIIAGKLEIVVTEEEPDWTHGRPEIFDSDEKRTINIYQEVHDKRVDYINGYDGYIFLDSYDSVPVKYKSTRTPERTLTEIQNFYETYHPLNSIVLGSRPIVEMNIEEGYTDHLDTLQNPNNLSGFYPISPSAVFNVHQDYYEDAYKNFFVFRKALGPAFYSNGIDNRVIYLPASLSGENRVRTIVIQSRYEIDDNDFYIRPYDENISFNVEKTMEILPDNDYNFKYTLNISATSNNDGGMKTLGTINMTSRIYRDRFVNVNTINNYNIPYYEFSQNKIDEIVPPQNLEITVIQLGTESGNNGDIELIGDRGLNVSVKGENRTFIITSDVEIKEPIITNEVNCEVDNISKNSFTVSIPSKYSNFDPCIPDDSESYISLNNKKHISLDVNVIPVDPSYDEYNETLSFIQPPINNGIVYGSLNIIPNLYIGDRNYKIVETIDSTETSLSSLLGLFPIVSPIASGNYGTLNELEITSNSSENRYSIISNKAYWYSENDGRNDPNINFIFPANNTDRTIERVYTIVYRNNGIIVHKITLAIEQQSSSGSFRCASNMYCLSHGECLNEDENELGWFDFETNIPKSQISVLVTDVLDESPVIQSKGGGKYKVSIKLKPNLTEDKRTTILNFMRNGTEIIKSVRVFQGYYCAKLYYPNSNNYIIHNNTIGNTSNYIDTPTRNEIEYGTRKTFNLELVRCEPTINGLWTLDTNIINSVNPKVSNYTWTLLGITNPNQSSNQVTNRGNESDSTERTTSNYFNSYSSVLVRSRTSYVENRYNVNSLYYGYEIKNKITITLYVDYPENDILSGYYVNPIFNILQNKLSE